MEFTFRPTGVCSRRIHIELDGDIVKAVRFEGGCSGNTQGIQSLVEGMQAELVIRKLKNIRCGFKKTSCPDQLAIALTQALEQQKKQG